MIFVGVCVIRRHFLMRTYRYFGLAQGWRYIQILRYEYMAKIMTILYTPYSQPINIIDRQGAGQLYLDILALIATQWLQGTNLIRNLFPQKKAVVICLLMRWGFLFRLMIQVYLDAHNVGLRVISHPEVGVRCSTIIV